MFWFTLSLLAAFFNASTSFWGKRYFSHLTTWELTCVGMVYATPFLLLTLPFIEIPDVAPSYWLNAAFLIPIMMGAMYYFMKAIQHSPLSLTMPFQSFTPGFAVLSGYLILGETVSPGGLAGIGLIIVGGYALNLDRISVSVWEPLKAIVRERGSVYMTISAALFGLAVVLGKLTVIQSSPMFMGLTFYPILAAISVLYMVLGRKGRFRNLFQNPGRAMISGLLFYGEVVTHNLAVSMITASYMAAIKRLNGLFGVGYGWIFFHDPNIRQRFIAASLMAIGAVCIILLG